MFQRILLAWDGSDVALHAFDVAIDVTRRCEGELVVLSIANSPSHAETPADRNESADTARRYLKASFAEVCDRAERAGIPVDHTTIESDSPGEALIAYGHEHGIDLFVCGHHHARRAGRLFLHGVVEYLVATSSIPVLIVGEEHR